MSWWCAKSTRTVWLVQPEQQQYVVILVRNEGPVANSIRVTCGNPSTKKGGGRAEFEETLAQRLLGIRGALADAHVRETVHVRAVDRLLGFTDSIKHTRFKRYILFYKSVFDLHVYDLKIVFKKQT